MYEALPRATTRAEKGRGEARPRGPRGGQTVSIRTFTSKTRRLAPMAWSFALSLHVARVFSRVRRVVREGLGGMSAPVRGTRLVTAVA
jgi:hypothetical protein